MEYASKGIANAGLTTGIIGTALGAMSTGILPGLLNGNRTTAKTRQAINTCRVKIYILSSSQAFNAARPSSLMANVASCSIWLFS